MADEMSQAALSALARWLHEGAQGEPPPEQLDPIAVKVNELNGMKYWDADDEGRFAEDYAQLTSWLRAPIGASRL